MSTNDQSLKSLWQKLPSETLVFTNEQMQTHARKFHEKHKRRDIIEYISWALFFCLVACMLTLQSDWQDWVASGLAVVGAIIAMWNYSRFMGLKKGTSAIPVHSLIDHMRGELTRQRDGAATAWKWYILPLTPFLVFVSVYRWIEEGSTFFEITEMRFSMLLFIGLMLAFTSAFILWKFLCAARYQRQLDTLDKYTK